MVIKLNSSAKERCLITLPKKLQVKIVNNLLVTKKTYCYANDINIYTKIYLLIKFDTNSTT